MHKEKRSSKWNITSLIELVFPPSEDELLLKTDVAALFFTEARVTHTPSFSYLLPYQEPAVRAAIHLNKFHHQHRALTLLSASLITSGVLKTHNAVVIAVPLSRRRERERGYNQVAEVLHQAKRQQPFTLSTTLVRTRHTTPQADLSRAERLTNLKDAFVVKDPTSITHQHILLVDDVVTTGATFQAAKAALLPHSPASITCLAFAH